MSRKQRINLEVVRKLEPDTVVWDRDVRGVGVRLQRSVPASMMATGRW